MEKFGFSLQSSYSLPMTQVIDLLANVGFCAVSPTWQPNCDLEETVRQARLKKLTVQSLHGPLRGLPAMWSPDFEIARPILQDMLQSATDCARFDIPILVVHSWTGVDNIFQPDAICFDHFDTLVTHAEKLGICIALENLEGPEFLAALLDRYANNQAIGLCWDSGHELCYAPNNDFLSKYANRLIMTHLNDNFGITDPTGRLQGTDDLHLFPGHGIIDWENIVRRLKAAKKQDILNFELKIRPKGDRCKLDLYSKMPLQQYFREAYENAYRKTKSYFD